MKLLSFVQNGGEKIHSFFESLIVKRFKTSYFWGNFWGKTQQKMAKKETNQKN